jgi:hypothetical protein
MNLGEKAALIANELIIVFRATNPITQEEDVRDF